MKILLVEDSPRLREALARGLHGSGFAVDVAGDGIAATGFLGTYTYDHMILDLGLPRLDGFGVLRALPAGSRRPRVLVLSARDQLNDRVAALNAGADDYLVKPFAFEELLARLRALARRPSETQADLLEYKGVRLDQRAHKVFVHGSEVQLPPANSRCLSCCCVIGARYLLVRPSWNESRAATVRHPTAASRWWYSTFGENWLTTVVRI